MTIDAELDYEKCVLFIFQSLENLTNTPFETLLQLKLIHKILDEISDGMYIDHASHKSKVDYFV